MMRSKHALCVIMLFFSGISSLWLPLRAQSGFDLTPLRYHPAQIQAWEKAYSASQSILPSRKNNHRLQLPFFEDFSQSYALPDTTKWERYSGAFINNTYAFEPPSVNVATLDGASGRGIPYQYGSSVTRARGDSLVSLPIDLSGFSDKNNIVFSFYWESGSPGAQNNPDFQDSLVVQFRDTGQRWQTVWDTLGGIRFDTNYTFEAIALTDPIFFHEDFQFRFYCVGNNTASNFDIWHIDYIRLDDGRTTSDSLTNDVAFSYAVYSLFSGYSAIPFEHLASDSSLLANPSAYQVLRSNDQLFAVGNEVQLYARQAPQTIFDSLSFNSIINQPRVPFAVSSNNVVDSATKLQQPADLVCRFSILNDSFDTIAVNDSIELESRVDNYFAYSDNSAELTRRLSSDSLAVPFVLPVSDTVQGIYINFVPGLDSTAGEDFKVALWQGRTDQNNRRRPGNLLYNSANLEVPEFRPGDWFFHELPQGFVLPARDTFFVGLIRENSDLFVGCDLNARPVEDTAGPMPLDRFWVFESRTNSWNYWAEDVCTPMFRVATGLPTLPEDTIPYEVDTSSPGDTTSMKRLWEQDEALKVYPNPARHQLWLSMPASTPKGEWTLFALDGRRLGSGLWQGLPKQEIALPSLIEGMYYSA